MSKTVSFPTAGRQLDAADDWVSGRAQKSSNTEIRKSTLDGKLARLTIDLPPDLHAEFKAACATHRTKKRDEVLAFIERWIQEHS
jgi:hypothetical protein